MQRMRLEKRVSIGFWSSTVFGCQIVELNQPLFSRKIASTSFWDFGATPPISTSKLNFGGFICFMGSSQD
ncbi:unnamed protein product, partial [Vitis vinifera]|uniref:Uncharacterized protein n=1 Tax=Vitis vinifera TaxID=29760 RepID=D7SLA0_VITVI